jgi:hypothetical protein
MRKLLFLSVVLSMVFFLVPPVQAQAPVSYESSVNVTNVSDTGGPINLVFYNPDGTVAANIPDTINAYETKVYTSFPGIASGFSGSMIIESSVPLASMGMVIGKNSAVQAVGYASYIGTSVGSTTVYLPLLMSNNYGFHTFFHIQNTSSGDVNVNINYSDGVTGPVVNGLKPGASFKVDNRLEPGHVMDFTGIVQATGPVAVAVVEYNAGSGNQLYSYNGFNSGTTNPIFPMINENNYGYWTSANIQNVGTTTTTVTLSYTPTEAGSACYETQEIPPGQKRDFATYVFAYNKSIYPHPITTNCVYKQRFIGGAVVTANSANQPLVGIVNQINTTDDPNKGAALMSQNPDTASNTVVFPNLQQWVGSWNWWTSLTIINVSGGTLSTGDIQCNITGTSPGGPFTAILSNPAPLANGAGWLHQFYKDRSPLPNGFVGGAVCSTPGGKIVGTMNILAANAGISIDSLGVYEGINP